MEDRSALLRELHRKVLYRALGDSVKEFEFDEDQIVPYYAQKPTRITCRDDIPKLLMETGPLQALRERGRNIYTYTDEDRKTVDGWIRELIQSGELGTVFLDEPHIMVADEMPFYAAATRKERELNETDQAVYGAVSMDTPLSEITEKLEISEDMAIRSLRKLESMYLITRSGLSGNKWLFGRVEFPEVDKSVATDRIVMRYLDCFAPASVQEVSYSLSLTDQQAHASLESLVANEDVVKGRFLVSENDQYMLKIDHMRLKAGRDNVYSYETVERYRLTKGQHFKTIREFFDFHGSAGSEIDVYNRVEDFNLEEWYMMRSTGEIQLGRFVRGKVRYVLGDDADRYAAIRNDETTPEDLELLNVIDGMGTATLRQLVAETRKDKDVVRDSVMRLDRSLMVIRAFSDKEDWGTENTYAVFRPGEPKGDPAKELTEKAIRAYGPLPAMALRYLIGIPLDVVDSIAAEVGAKVVSVGEGQSPMYIMEDEIPALEQVTEEEYPIRLLSLFDPDLGSKWAEIAARYGDRWIYPLVRGATIVGALEIWEMSGVIEVRSMDMDYPEMLQEVLGALDGLMGFYNQKGIEIVRIREILNVDAADLDEDKRKVLEDNGYVFVNGFYAKGRFDPWTFTDEQMVTYVFNRQRVSRSNMYPTVAECVAVRGYIRGDQEIMTRVSERTTMKKQMEKGYLMKMSLVPAYQGYTDSEHAPLFRAMKGYVPDEDAKTMMELIAKKQPISKKQIVADSPLSLERTNEIFSDLSKYSVIYQDADSCYNLVPDNGMTQLEAAKEIAKMHFRDFGIFSAEDMSSFLSSRMMITRRVLSELEDEGFLKKGFFVADDPTLRWMIAEDVGKPARRGGESLILNSQDNLSVYFRDRFRTETGTVRSVIIANNKVIGSFVGKICPAGAKVEEFQGSERAARMMKEVAQSLGMRLESQRQREDEDWDVSEFYTKVNTGA
jgi:ATP-dependent Lhr-like helicase